MAPRKRSTRTKRTRLTSPARQDEPSSSAPAPTPPPAAAAAASRPRRPMVSRMTAKPYDAPEEASAKPIRLTVKAPAGKGRETAGARKKRKAPAAATALLERSPIVTGPRATRAKQTIIETSDTDESEESGEGQDGDAEEDEEMGNDADEDAGVERDEEQEDEAEEEEEEEEDDDDDEEEEEEEAEDDDDDAEAESVGGDEDEGNDAVASSASASRKTNARPATTVTSAKGQRKGENTKDVSVEGDDEDDASSRASTPDLARFAKRQRARGDLGDTDLLELPSDSKAKKIISEEEHAMRRAEMARRRKNLSEKRKEEEKIETINKLLKKQAPKQKRTRLAEGDGDGTPQETEPEKPNPVFVRWISNRHGSVLAVPQEWLGTPLGQVFDGGPGKNPTTDTALAEA